LKHWNTALELGAVHRKIIVNKRDEEILLENAIEMLVSNCFPIAIVCYTNKKKEKEIWMTPLWVEIFNFLDGKSCIRKEDDQIYFEEMEDYKQQAVLNAWIESVWLAED